MGYTLIKITPKAEPFLSQDFLLNEQNYLALVEMERIVNFGIIPPRYASAAALKADIVNPLDDMQAIVTGTGLVYFKNPDWVKASDDTTVV